MNKDYRLKLTRTDGQGVFGNDEEVSIYIPLEDWGEISDEDLISRIKRGIKELDKLSGKD